MPLNVIVCIKQVPDWEAPADTFKIDPEKKRLIPPANIDPRISLFDEHAIEAALQIREQHGGKVTIVSLGPDFAQRAVKQAVAMGADEGIFLKDPAFEDSDTYATAYILAAAIKKIGSFDVILCGRQAADWDVGQVGLGIAELLGIPCVSIAQKLEVSDGTVIVERIVEGGFDVMEASLPALITVSNEINKPRHHGSREKTDPGVGCCSPWPRCRPHRSASRSRASLEALCSCPRGALRICRGRDRRRKRREAGPETARGKAYLAMGEGV